MTRIDQRNEIINYAISKLERAKKYGSDMKSSSALCLEDAKEHINNALNIQSLPSAEKPYEPTRFSCDAALTN